MTSSEKKQTSIPKDKIDLDYMDDSKSAQLMDIMPFANTVLYALLAFIVIGLFWAYFAKIDEITVAQGKVIPSSQVKHIQNLEGGILAKLLVKEGQVVKKGQVIAALDDTRFSSEYRSARAKYLALLATIARLQAEATGKEKITFPNEVNQAPKKLIQKEINLFKSRQVALQDSIKTLQRSYDLAKRELSITGPLVKKGIMSKLELLRLERQVNELKGELSKVTIKFKEEAQTELNNKQNELDALKESIQSLKDRMARTTIRSPVRGIVKQININTIGGVLKPGDDMMEIVPLEDSLLVEARITPKDIAFIRPNQKATVKVTAYDYSIYGGLEGKVTHISADSSKDEDGKHYFEVWVRTGKNHLGTKEKPLPIIPGMTASVHILTGEKTIMDYLLKPLLKAKQNALRER